MFPAIGILLCGYLMSPLPVVGLDAEEAFVASTILATLDRRDADLLVCGSRAYGPLRRVLRGLAADRRGTRGAAVV